MDPGGAFEAHQVDLHGHRAVYRIAGSGPTVVLIHGMVNSSRHWEAVALARLADSYRVIAPDLIGHGDSATPRGDYSLGAHAASIRDLLATIGVERATIVGHSLGGGVAMQFFYQFPQRTERLVLVSSGGLGRDVSPLLRGAALPGAAALLCASPRSRAGRCARPRPARACAPAALDGVYLQAVARALRPLQDPGSRRAFLQTLRSVIDVHGPAGQRPRPPLPARRHADPDRLGGARPHDPDRARALDAHEAIPHCRFETLPRAAHFPHLEDPEGLRRSCGTSSRRRSRAGSTTPTGAT